MNFPLELTNDLFLINYNHLSKLSYNDKLQALKKPSEKIMALKDWAESQTEPIEGWVELFFDYFELMTPDIEAEREIWTSYYELERSLKSFLLTMMRRQKQTPETILHFGESLNNWLLQTRHGAIVSGFIMSMLLDYSTPLKTMFRLDDEAGEALYDVYALWIDTLFRLAEKATSHPQISRLKSAIYYLETEMRNIDYKENSPKQLEPLMNQILLFQLSVFSAKAYINQEDLVEKIYDGEPLGEIQLPPAGNLLEEGKKLFDTHRKQAVLYLLLHNVLVSMDVAAKNSNAIRENHSAGGNIANVDGVSALTTFLELLMIYTDEASLIAGYLADYIVSNDALFVVASVMGQETYGVSPERENVKRRIVLALIQRDVDTPEQIALKRLCVRWGLLERDILPAKYQFKAPAKLPSNANEVIIFYTVLQIGKEFRLNKRAKEEDIPEGFPEDIRQVYRIFNGAADDRHFAKLSRMDMLLKDIMDTYESDLEDADEDDLDSGEGKVDIRKHIHPGIIPIGTTYSGDMCFADPNCLSVTGHPVIIQYFHDNYLTGELVANSLAEFLGRLMIERFTEVNGNEKQLTALLDTPIQIHPDSMVSENPLQKLISKGERRNSTGHEYFASSTTKLLIHAFSMFEEIPYERRQQFVIPEAYIEFLQILDNDTIVPFPAQELYIYGFYGMITHTFDYFDCEGDLGHATAFWLAVGHRNDRGNFFLCCDKASELYGKVGEFYDSTPFTGEDNFYDIGIDFPGFCKNVMDGKVY